MLIVLKVRLMESECCKCSYIFSGNFYPKNWKHMSSQPLHSKTIMVMSHEAVGNISVLVFIQNPNI